MQRRALAGGIAIDEVGQHAPQVFLGARQPVLQGQKVRPQILRRARDKAQYPRQLAQHPELPRAGAGFALIGVSAAGVSAAGLAAQAFEQGQGGAGVTVHTEATHARELHDRRARQAADHRVAVLAARLEGRPYRVDMVLQEQHVHHDDVAAGDIVATARQRRGVGVPVRGGVDLEGEAGNLRRQRVRRAPGAPGDVVVQSHEDKIQRAVSD